MTAFTIIPNLTFVPREDWQPKDDPRLGAKVDRDNRTHVIIHHTVMEDESDKSPHIWESHKEISQNMREVQTSRPDLGLDVPYNFVAYLVPGDGLVICEGRGEDRTGAHTKGHNTAGIAVSFAGNFHKKSVPLLDVSKRIHLLSYFLGWLKLSASHTDYGKFPPLKNLDKLKPSGRKVFMHRDFKATACPGDRLEQVIDQVAFLDPATA